MDPEEERMFTFTRDDLFELLRGVCEDASHLQFVHGLSPIGARRDAAVATILRLEEERE